MRYLPFIAVAILLIAADSGAKTPAAAVELPPLRQAFDQALSEAATAHEQHTREMPGQYVKAIETLEAERRQSGDLGAVIALRSERARFLTESNVVVEAARAEHPAILRLKRQYLRKQAHGAVQRDEAILRAAETYTNHLTVLKQQLTRSGRMDAALLLQAEEQSVTRDPRVQGAARDIAANRLAEADEGDATNRPIVALSGSELDEETAAAPGDPARLIAASIVSFSFSDRDVTGSTVLTRLQRLCLDRGVTLRFASRRIELRTSKTGAGTPRFVSGFRPATVAGTRPRTFALHEVPLRTVLQAVCLTAGLGYTIDPELKAVVLVDMDEPGAVWSPDPLPAAQIAKERVTVEWRRQHIGRTALAEGEVATALQGIADYIITLKDGVRVCLPQTPASRTRFEQIRNALGAAPPVPVQLTAMGTIGAESSGQGVTVGDAVLLEITIGRRYSIASPSR
jgi:phage tail protein X